MGFDQTCNATLEEMMREIDEIPVVGPFNFHELALMIAGGCSLVSILFSFYLMWMHALNYTKPREQKHIIRILLMVPIYTTAAFLQLYYPHRAIYFQVMSECYEAFAMASFFSLMCHYVAPDLHSQKNFFRNMVPIKPWVWPIDWFALCSCARNPKKTGIWRTPKSGLTWFNIIWIGIYHYCFVRVGMTITAVVTQYFGRYCESSNSPVFAHIWVLSINSLAVSVAMYCVIQFYVQLRTPLAPHRPFLKVLAIKLVIFLSFWQIMTISVVMSSGYVQPSEIIAYADLKVGIPALLLCFEMAVFAILHLWAFPYRPYRPGVKPSFYPSPYLDDEDEAGDGKLGKDGEDTGSGISAAAAERRRMARDNRVENLHTEPGGGFMGLRAFLDAANIWDVIKGFARGMRWLFCGVRGRKGDVSYRNSGKEWLDTMEMGTKGLDRTGAGANNAAARGYGGGGDGDENKHLPIADLFRRSKSAFELLTPGGRKASAASGGGGAGGMGMGGHAAVGGEQRGVEGEEFDGLIDNAAASPAGGMTPVRGNGPISGGGPGGIGSSGLGTPTTPLRPGPPPGTAIGGPGQEQSYSSPGPGVIPPSPYRQQQQQGYQQGQQQQQRWQQDDLQSPTHPQGCNIAGGWPQHPHHQEGPPYP